MSEITVDPPAANVPAAGGNSQHAIVNNTGGRLAIKVKCSDNALYRVQPVFSFAEPGAPITIEVQRLPGPPKEDKLVIQYMPAGEVPDPKDAFPAGGTFPEVPMVLSAQ